MIPEKRPSPIPSAVPSSVGKLELSGPDPLTGTAYKSLGILGQGGMGVVLDAEHVGLRKRVVVKLLRRELAERPDLIDRMRVEGQTLAQIARTNPHLVDVTDFGQTPAGRTFLVMERLYGKTLKDELRERRFLPIAEAIVFMRQALSGLSAAHGAGIVHRDMKLDNLFICDAAHDAPRVLKVLDFGIAKILHAGEGGRPAPVAYPTEAGTLMGTPRFLSPEQAKGHAVDARTDLYGAGIVLYTLIAGRGPFHHINDAVALLQAHAFEEPAPPSRMSQQPIPPALDAIILKAIAKKPEDRYPSAAAFSEALRIFAERPSGMGWERTEPVPGRPGSQPPPAAGVRVTKRGTMMLPDAPPMPLGHASTELAVASPEPPPAGKGLQDFPEAIPSALVPTVRRPSKPATSNARWLLFFGLIVASTVLFTAILEIVRRFAR